MEKRKIGKSDLEVYPFDLGGNVFGWTADEKTSFEILDIYTDAGFNFIDTANVYSVWAEGHKGGESETILGKWIKDRGNRSNLIITTKVGAEISRSSKGLKKEYILEQAEESLKRLQTDYIDLYFTHYDDTSTPIEETLEAYGQLIKEGKIRYIGASNMSACRIEESIKTGRENGLPEYVCLQPQYNLYDRKVFETEYEPLAKEYDLGVVPYQALASGFLTGKYKFGEEAKGNRAGAVKNYLNDRGRRIIQAVQEVAKEYNATPAQISIAWLITHPSVTAPIASMSKPEQKDILKAVDIQLSEEAFRKLTNAGKE